MDIVCIYLALASLDYTSTNQILSFSPGNTRLTVSVPTINDGVFEGDEIFEAVLSLPAVGSARINLRDERAAAVIEDNDGKESSFNCIVNYESALSRCQSWLQSNHIYHCGRRGCQYHSAVI